MEKRKKKVKISDALQKDFVLRIFSVVLAVIIWIILSITLFPTIYTTVYDVPVKLEIEGTDADANGLSALNYEEVSVDVRLSGMRYEIGNYNADDLVATLNLEGVTRSGTYELPITVKSAHDDNCEIIKISPAKVKVSFDNIKSLEIPLSVDYSGISADEGYTLKTPVVEPETIKVSGPEGEIQKIDKAVVKVRGNSQKLTESYATSDTELVLYTKDGAVINQTNLTFSENAFTVTFPVYMAQTVPFTLTIQQCPSNFDQSILKYSFNPETITILSNGDIANLSSKNAGYLYLNQIDLDTEFTFDVELDNGQINDSGIDQVTVKFDKTGFASKTFTLNASHIKVINKIVGKTVEVKTEKIPKVVIYGPESVIKKLTADDLIAEYDMEGSQLDNGSYEANVRIYAPSIDTVWCYGSYDIIVTISDEK